MAQEEVTNGAAAAEKTVKFTAFKPQLTVEAPKAADAVQFYKSAFGAVETSRSQDPKRKAEQELPFLSAELQIAGSTVVVSDTDSVPKTEGGLQLALCLETEDVEAAVTNAVAAGAVKEGEAPDGECCGGVQSKVKDPYGFTWFICSPPKKTADAAEA